MKNFKIGDRVIVKNRTGVWKVTKILAPSEYFARIKNVERGGIEVKARVSSLMHKNSTSFKPRVKKATVAAIEPIVEPVTAPVIEDVVETTPEIISEDV